MIRTYKYRLYPTNAQDRALDFLLWQGRLLYNAALEQRINAYKNDGKSVTYPQQWAYFRDQRHENPDTLGKLNAASVQQLLRRLDKAFRSFFRRLKAGEKPGFPRYKGRTRFNSLEYRHGDGCKLKFDAKHRALLYIQNVGDVKVKYHRPIPDEARIKHVVLKRKNRKWYICLQIELPDPVVGEHSGPAVGIDMGLHSILASSDGQTIENPRWLRKSLAKLRVAQRRLSRRKKGGARRRKAAAQVARLHERITNQRLDFWHKTTRRLVDTYGLIAVEDLTLNFLTSNRHLALSAHDAGLGMFRQLLAYKAESAGVRVVAVNPAHTSQVCSSCGELVEKTLGVRIHRCPSCGYTADRDVNAARNILDLAVKSARTGPPGVNVAGCGVRSLGSSLL
ncbi:putative transposase [Desulfacinum hydrothermale DSM 13146]|uniref:Putative transposase n=1 Tax=Desulfacinum hydrothermale DSM 13146 TaxID=1121390 RepID=A0A1W1XWK2_9BACT|nr:RNA-guided endonuclease TnpB family protein [Desulfacinum hydrothermale]SMC28370.1 putative transposase [Desulfacinum hydrothermale DSM 13146]